MSEIQAEKIVQEILEEFREEWGLDDVEITPKTKLVADFGFESTDTMQLFLGIQEAYPSIKFPFQELVMTNNGFVKDLSVADVTNFVNLKCREAALLQVGESS